MSGKERIATAEPLPETVDTSDCERWVTVKQAAGKVPFCERIIWELVSRYDISRKVRGKRWIYLPALRSCIDLQTSA